MELLLIILVAAIIGDPDLGERQKQVLLDIYESFRRENAQLRADAGSTAASSSETAAAPAAQ